MLNSDCVSLTLASLFKCQNILEVIQQEITAELLERKCWEEPISVKIYQVELITLWQYPVIINMMSMGKISKMPVDTRAFPKTIV